MTVLFGLGAVFGDLGFFGSLKDRINVKILQPITPRVQRIQ